MPTQDTPPHALDDRLIDLEIKLGFMEDLVEHLNQTVIEQQQTIDLLVREVSQLKQHSADTATPSFRSLRDELPPHY